jgi:predicted protein tyrosine phosphatase
VQSKQVAEPDGGANFATRGDIEVSSAGTNNDAENSIDTEQVEWADVIVVMEKHHRNKLQKRFYSALKSRRVVVLDIPDEYGFMDEGLIRLLRAKMLRHLPA